MRYSHRRNQVSVVAVLIFLRVPKPALSGVEGCPSTPLILSKTSSGRTLRVDRPVGVVAIAGLFLAASTYLAVIGFTKLLSPDAVSLSMGAPLLHGLELAGPYMFLIGQGSAQQSVSECYA